MSISDNIIIMNKGVIAQMGTPQQVYYNPASEFVADFIGEANFLKVKVDSVEADAVGVSMNGVRFPVRKPEIAVAAGEEHTVMIRPEGVRVSDAGILPCKVVLSCFMGSYQNYHVMEMCIRDSNQNTEAFGLLRGWRNSLLDEIHNNQYKLDCLDYLMRKLGG